MYYMGNLIKIGVKSKNIIYLPGAIKRFVDTYQLDKVRTESGFELANTPTNKFLIGAQVEQLYLQYNSTGLTIGDTRVQNGIIGDIIDNKDSGGDTDTETEEVAEDSPFDDTITRYWGVDEYGNAIVQQWINLFEATHEDTWTQCFRVDGRPITFPGRDFRAGYWLSVPEIKAALDSQESWEAYINIMASYARENNLEDHIYFNRDLRVLGDISETEVSQNIYNIIGRFENRIRPVDLSNTKRASVYDENTATIAIIYSYIRDIASKYYGKKFMVRVPFVLAKIDENFEIQTSLEPTNSGYLEESEEERSVSNFVLPNFTDFVKDEDGKIVCYVRFDGGDNLITADVSQIPDDMIYFWNNYFYVKCSVDPKLVFLDRSTAFSPRAVIELPGPVFVANKKDQNALLIQARAIRNGRQIEELSDDEKKQLDVIGQDLAHKSILPTTFYPNLAVIPLKDNTTVYGPWYSSSSIRGKVEFEQNHDINPWSFGGFRNMNNAALSIVNEVYANSLESESGSLEIPGAPTIQLGADLIDKGPTVTDINVTVDPDNGVTTSYRMSRWNLRPGRENKH